MAKAMARRLGVGDNDLNKAVTIDLHPDRVNPTVWDEHVVAASIG